MNETSNVRHTDDELRAMAARGEDKTDWMRAGAVTQEELEASIPTQTVHRRVFRMEELRPAELQAIAKSDMDHCHNHLDDELK
jgi:hypothetical protein